MNKLIQQNENGIIWVQNEHGEEFGIISDIDVLDWDNTRYDYDTFTVLENNGFQLEQNRDNGTTYIDFIEENGETSRLVFSNNNVEIVEASLL